MSETNLDLVRHRFQKARDHLKSAEILLDAGMYSDSLSRSYYTMFAAARALLALKQLDSKKHSGVISLFNQHFVKPEIVDRATGRDLSKARVRRESSDYTDFYLVTKEEAASQLETAKRFLANIETALERMMTGLENNKL
ncbi:HEPN domain-containing protein [Desulfofundulus salinus]|uniref:HEPN domain-containing protein n=1 Tax=Desulfofundulus salinus TaxID=2419843 RepID=UPI001FAAAD20|nr:HEPN domain-containing protein [Desulfofundulus salinum]